MVKIMKKDLNYFKKLLPKKLTVEIHKTKEGFWAKIKNKEFSNCYTQANSFCELIKMVNDAIYTHLDIPVKFRKKSGFYLPDFITEELKRKHWEDVFSNIIKKERLQKDSAVFQLNSSKLCV